MKDSSGMTLVMLAAAGGQDDLLRLLIRKGAKVNGRQRNGTTALIHAAAKVGGPASDRAGICFCEVSPSHSQAALRFPTSRSSVTYHEWIFI